MKNWLLIIGLLSLHGCRVFNQEANFNKFSPYIFHDDAYNLSLTDDATENPDNSSKGIKHLLLVAGEEEQEHILWSAFTHLKASINTFLFNKSKIAYCIRNLPDKFHGCIYIFCKALII